MSGFEVRQSPRSQRWLVIDSVTGASIATFKDLQTARSKALSWSRKKQLPPTVEARLKRVRDRTRARLEEQASQGNPRWRPPDERYGSMSIRTVSGGLPTHGKHR